MKPSYTSQEALNRAQLSAARFFDAPYGPFISRVHPNLAAKVREDNATRQAEVSQRRAEAYRLVEAAKSPTDRFPGLTGQYFNRTANKRFLKRNPKTRTDSGREEADHVAPDLSQPGTWAVVEKRDWCGESRLRLETRPGAGVQTPENEGDRWTAMLSERGARKISEACYFMACKHGGFSTFATLTLNNEARARLAKKGRKPVYKLDSAGFPNPAEPARAKQGPLGIQYQTEGNTPTYNVSEINQNWTPVRVNDPDYGPLYCNPLRAPEESRYIWSLQREVSRFFEAANKMFTRGWQYRRAIPGGSPRLDAETNAEFCPITGDWETIKVGGSRKCVPKKRPTAHTDRFDAEATAIKFVPEPLAYLWVAENPNRTDENGDPLPICDEQGEYDETATNPHIHLMMKWRVEYRHFPYWSRRLEKLWGHGFAHLEKIKDPSKAGSYVAKAAGYLTKGQGPENWQGEIRGNRYAISSRARAPGWIECERHQIGMMGWLLAEAHEVWNNKHGNKIKQRENLKYQLEKMKDPRQRQKIGKLLEGVRKKIEPLPRISKYAALFKSEEQKTKFFDWASRRGWQAKPQNSLWLEEWRGQQWLRRNRGRLRPRAEDWTEWFAMADSGAVACNDERLEDVWW